ncbi:MAG TPA: PilZ domain-containing protein [Thermoanaerobaculaceae bacterium]|nr:PilZ domain-containing protein [Thermoanaerobaculaceae bacterium]HQU33947.1 PilZ domain-containing protein [Thermoanaerobaculaceae bacterium]
MSLAQATGSPAAGRELLVVGCDGATRDRVRAGVAAAGHRVTDADDAAAAFRIAAGRHFDALLVSHPLAGVPTRGFLKAVRDPDSPCHSSGLVLVAEEPARREAEAYLGRGANRVIAAERVEQAVAEVLRPLLRVPARAALRLPVRLQVLGGGLQRRVVCESVNLSRHGALLRAPHSLIEGTELRFELFLPEAPLPVCGEAVVVRRTAQGREPYPGIGVQFIAFALGAEDAIKARVDAYRSGRLRPVN